MKTHSLIPNVRPFCDLTIGAACAALALLNVSAFAGTTLNPITTSGYDQDIVVESGATVGSQVTTAAFGSRNFFQEGLSTEGANGPGLTPSVNGVTSGSGDTINFNFQSFAGNNSLMFDSSDASATKGLTFSSPAAYSQLAFVFTGANAKDNAGTSISNLDLSYTINYQGGGTQSGTLYVNDWGTTDTSLAPGVGVLTEASRISMGSQPGIWNNQVPETTYVAGRRWSVYYTEVTPGESANITSIDFSNLTAAGVLATSSQQVAILGLSGTLTSVPEPTVAALGGLGMLLLIGAQRSRRRA